MAAQERSLLSREAREYLQELAQERLPDVRDAFRNYAEEINACEWAAFGDGELERFVECFSEMARVLVDAELKELGTSSEGVGPWVERSVRNLIKSICTAPILVPPTWPWRTAEFFDRGEFLEAMRAMIQGHLMDAGCIYSREPKRTETQFKRSPARILNEYKVKMRIRTQDLVAEALGLERSVYFELKAGRKVSEETYIKAAQRIGCSPDDLKP